MGNMGSLRLRANRDDYLGSDRSVGYNNSIKGVSYGMSQSWGNQGQTANSNLNAGYQGSKGSISTGYSSKPEYQRQWRPAGAFGRYHAIEIDGRFGCAGQCPRSKWCQRQ